MFLPKLIQQGASLVQALGKGHRESLAVPAIAKAYAGHRRSRAAAKESASHPCFRKKTSASKTSASAPAGPAVKSKASPASQACPTSMETTSTSPPTARLLASPSIASSDDDTCTERRSDGGSSVGRSVSSAGPSGRSSFDGAVISGGETKEASDPECRNAVVTPSEEQALIDAGSIPYHVVSELNCSDPFTRVEVVVVQQPEGGSSSGSGQQQALRVTFLRNHKVTGKPRRKRSNRTPLLQHELQRQSAAHKALGGSPHGVKLLGESVPARESDPHVLLLSYEPGASLESYMDCLAMDEIHRDFDAMLARPKPRKPARRTNNNGVTPPRPPTLVLTGNTIMPEPQLKRLAVCLLSALAALHEAGICHGAIAPDCVSMISGNSTSISTNTSISTRFVVTRCGLALPVDETGSVAMSSRTRVAESALEYAAPEVRARLATATPGGGSFGAAPSAVELSPVTVACDVASVGLLLLDAAAFRATTYGLRDYTEGRLALPAQLPKGLRDLVGLLTSADVSQRLTARQALAHPYLQDLM